MKLYIDAGHGGTDSGAVGNGLVERDLNVQVANLLADLMRGSGVTVKQNRTASGAGATMGLNDRIKDANNWGADAYISVHTNSAAGTAGTGFEIFHFSGGGKSKEMATAIDNEVRKFWTSRGIKTRVEGGKDFFAVIRDTKAPAVLAEMAFLNNPSDAAKLKDPKWLLQIAEAYAKGICAAFGVKPSAPPATTQPKEVIYRVRKVWSDERSQVGAYKDLQNAINMCNQVNPYSVYDENGKQVYPK